MFACGCWDNTLCVCCLWQELLKLYQNLSIVDRMSKKYGSAIAYAKRAQLISRDSAKAYFLEAKVIYWDYCRSCLDVSVPSDSDTYWLATRKLSLLSIRVSVCDSLSHAYVCSIARRKPLLSRSVCPSICVSVRDSLSHAYVRSIGRREPPRLPACQPTCLSFICCVRWVYYFVFNVYCYMMLVIN